MSSVLPGRHPDDDVLADLAAEVLPEPEARTVEAHVIGCPRCAELLADAERLRRLLIAEDPGPMPLDVLARIESALQAEASARSAGQVTDPDPTRTGSRVAVPVQPSPRSPSGSAPGEDAWIDEPTPWDDPGSWNRAPGAPQHLPGTASPSGSSVPRGARTRPAGRPAATGRSRRDLRESTRPGIPARGRWLAGAAGVVLLAGLGGIAVMSGLGMNASDTSATSGMASMEEAAKSAAAGGDAGAVPFYSSGTAYSSKQFVAQVRNLVVSPPAVQGPEGSTTSRTTRAPAPAVSPLPSLTVSGRDAVGTAAPAAPAVGGVAALREPKRLAECLSALGQAGATPVAVDFARYEGREAAVIVLPGRTDGYEAWAVDPTCGPDGDGLLTVQQIPPS